MATRPTPHKVTKSQRQSLMTQYQRLCSQAQTQYSYKVIKLCLYYYLAQTKFFNTCKLRQSYAFIDKVIKVKNQNKKKVTNSQTQHKLQSQLTQSLKNAKGRGKAIEQRKKKNPNMNLREERNFSNSPHYSWFNSCVSVNTSRCRSRIWGIVAIASQQL